MDNINIKAQVRAVTIWMLASMRGESLRQRMVKLQALKCGTVIDESEDPK